MLQNRFQESTEDGMGEIINSVARTEKTVKTVDQNASFVWSCETNNPSLIGSPKLGAMKVCRPTTVAKCLLLYDKVC